ncbi:MAG: 30S ribosomal protein S8, partial [Pseudomonadota bacterium]
MNDPLGDMLTRIRNAQMRNKTTVMTPASKLRGWVLDVLVEEGYIRGYERAEPEPHKPVFEIALKYFDGQPAIKELKRISTPGRRSYSAARAVPMVRNGLGVAIVSTNRGVMSDHRARAENVGGEVLCT